jgi:hypothetical protein
MIRRSIVAWPENSTSIIPSPGDRTAAVASIGVSNRLSIAARLTPGSYQPERKAT